MTLLTPELQARIGETAVYTAPEELGRASIRYFALAIGDYNPLYVDPRAAQDAGMRDVMAPPTMLAETNQYMIGPRGEDGYMGHGWGIEIPGTRLVRGGNEYEFVQPVHPDDVVTATWTIARSWRINGSWRLSRRHGAAPVKVSSGGRLGSSRS